MSDTVELCTVCKEEHGKDVPAAVTGGRGALCPIHYCALLVFKDATDHFGLTVEESLDWTNDILSGMENQVETKLGLDN